MSATALIVDDEIDLCRLMQLTLKKAGVTSDLAYDLKTAHQFLKKNQYDFCLTDMKLPDGSGLDLVKYIIENHVNTPVAVITAYGSIDLSLQSLKMGAFDFVNKPLELPRLRQLVSNAIKVSKEAKESSKQSLKTQKSPAQTMLDERLIGDSPIMQRLKSTIVKLARSQAPVFLWGASGTGKEVVARLIHDLSPRREGSFVPVNCGAIPSELMESEFFGHKKGSFTGATTDKQGLFQQANGGTLFLDEVADLPLAMQVKLLRAIQEKTVRAIGDTKEQAVDIRILSATHKDLNTLVQIGDFRQDLFYRINVIEVKLPTLNQRADDIPMLAKHFLKLIGNDWQLEEELSLSDDAITMLKHYDFEGNVRELRNLLERAVTLADSNVLDQHHLDLHAITLDPPINNEVESKTEATEQNHQEKARNANYQSSQIQFTTNFNNKLFSNKKNSKPESHINPSIDESTQIDNLDTGNALDNRLEPELSAKLLTGLDPENGLPKDSLEQFLHSQERIILINALEQTNWNKTKAAKLLGMSLRSLRYRMDKLNVNSS